MLLKTSLLSEIPIMSIQTGAEIATVGKILVSPTTLKIIGFELAGKHLTTYPSFLRTEDIRELSNIGFIVNSSDECVGLDDVISIKEIYQLDFDLNGMLVIDKTGKKLGKIYDTVFATETFTIEQLCVQKPFLKSFSDAELLIHRSQIVEINHDSVVVRSQIQPIRTAVTVSQVQNPFRSNQANTPQPETTDLQD